jgi:GAF domain-containing protein
MTFQVTALDGTPEERYTELLQQLNGLLHGEPDWLANLSNAASLIYMQLDRINWAGFYLMRGGELVLGPFGGKPACTRIPLGKGVCGTAAARREVQVVPDVFQFPGHIACDADSRAEIVLPLVADGRVVGVLDIDSPHPGRFTDLDRRYLEQVAALLVPWAAQGSDFA